MKQTDWPSIEINSWQTFVLHANEHVSSGARFAYRGQADVNWDLCPSLLRDVARQTPIDALLRLEQQGLAEFKAQAHLYIGAEHLPEGSETLAWWALMQHHGAPTRLLDWTTSPFVAAYFAVEQQPRTDGVVIVVDTKSVQASLDERYTNGERTAELTDFQTELFRDDAPEQFFFWNQPMRRSQRSVSQQGLMSASINLSHSHDAVRETCRKHNRVASHLEPARLWIFPASVKAEVLRYLRVVNITAQSLFPGLDGLGRSIREVIRIGQSLTQTVGGAHISSTKVYPPATNEE